MPFGRIKAKDQLFFLNSSQVFGIQSYSIDNNFGAYPVNYIGIGSKSINQNVNSAQSADLNLDSILVSEDLFQYVTGNNPSNFFILKNLSDTYPYVLNSGYLMNYSLNFSPNQLITSKSSFRFFSNVGQINTGSLDVLSFSQYSGIISGGLNPFNNEIGNSNFINLSINESTGNRVTNFSFSIDINRIPIYNIGYPPFKRAEIIYPINFSCDITFEPDLSFNDYKLNNFANSKIIQNLEIDVYANRNYLLMNKYFLKNATMVSQSRAINADSSVSIRRTYVGQIFNYTDKSPNSFLDFGFVASGINYYLDFGYVNLSPTGNVDFGSF